MTIEPLITAAKYEWVTALFALEGLIISLFCAVLVLFLQTVWFRSKLLSDPIFVTLYALPPFATVIAVSALRLESSSVPLMVAVGVIYPLYILLSEALEEAKAYTKWCNCGSEGAKFFQITLPAASAGIIFSIGTCLPWVLLAAMLAEIATSTHGGMGIRLLNVIQKGKIESAPYLVTTAFVSIISYLIFIGAAHKVRRRLFLVRRNIALEDTSDNGRSAFLETIALAMAVAIFWASLHEVAPLLAQSPLKIFNAVKVSQSVIIEAMTITLVTTIVALALGGVLGFVCAILAKVFPIALPIFVALLFPLQIIPLIVFIPNLLAWHLSLKHYLWSDPIFPPVGLVGVIPFMLPTLAIGVLATGYAFYEIGKNQLVRLPISRGALLETRKRWDIRVLEHIDLPWLLRAGSDALDVAMPRTLLAVLVTEILVTSSGLGGYLSDQRARSNFAQAWSALILLLFLIAVLRIATNPKLTSRMWTFRS